MKLITLALGCSLLLAVPLKMSSRSQVSTKLSRTPVTITYLVKYFDEQGRPAENEVMVRAFRSDGSTAQYKLSTTATPSIRSVADYRARIQASVDPLIKAVVKKSLVTAPQNPATCEAAYGPGNCKGVTPQTMLDFKLEAVTMSDHPLGYIQDYLLAPDLDYVYLQRTDKDETGLTFADARMFDIPADYEVVARSVYYDRGMRARGKVPEPNTVERLALLDAGKIPPATMGNTAKICAPPK